MSPLFLLFLTAQPSVVDILQTAFVTVAGLEICKLIYFIKISSYKTNKSYIDSLYFTLRNELDVNLSFLYNIYTSVNKEFYYDHSSIPRITYVFGI